ncbi:MAG: glycerophosphodiester phosphodiesterase [Chloroflexota bacterium]|nr:glycerophosphodiester phosphodiesterase [Chloroflexota bacterium]
MKQHWGKIVALLAIGLLIRRAQRPVRRVAHRGGAADAPENTLAAFRGAGAAGIGTWELDVQLTTDGALAVFHDETLDRTTDGSGPLAGHSLAELQALDAGAWFGPGWVGERIPTLEAVITLARGQAGGGAQLLIEIKSPHLYPGIERRLLDVLAAEAYADRVLIMSFDGDSLARVRALDPSLPLCHLTGAELRFPRHPAAAAEVLGPPWPILALNPLIILAAHRAGRQVYTWTVNSRLAATWLRVCGIDGIISDRLDLLRAVREA